MKKEDIASNNAWERHTESARRETTERHAREYEASRPNAEAYQREQARVADARYERRHGK